MKQLRLALWVTALASLVFSGCSDDDKKDDEPCSADEYLSEEGICVQLTACGDGQYIVAEPTETSDRVCAQLTECGEHKYLFKAVPTDGSAEEDNLCCHLVRGTLIVDTGDTWPVGHDPEDSCFVVEGTLRLDEAPSAPVIPLVGINGSLDVRYYGSEDLRILQGLSFVGRGVEISDNEHLLSLAGLESLESVDGSITIGWNPKLKNLDALSSLHSAEAIYLYDLPAIESRSYFDQMETLDSFGIENVPSNAPAFKKLKKVDYVSLGTMASSNNFKVIEGIEEVRDLTITHQEHIRSLEGFPENLNILEKLYITDNDSLTSLRGIPTLKGDWIARPVFDEAGNSLTKLEIRGNDGLIDLNGLEELEIVRGELVIMYNRSLESLAGLGNLQSAWSLVIRNNDRLTSLAGLEALSYVSDLSIVSMFKLSNLSGLENIATIDSMNIHGNNELRSFQGLENVWYIGQFSVIENPKLESFDGLSSLLLIDRLNVHYNQRLENMDGMPFVEQVFDGISILGNALLSSLPNWQRVFAWDSWYKASPTLEIGGNPRLCNSAAEAFATRLSDLYFVRYIANNGSAVSCP